jgi:hypothetical protein
MITIPPLLILVVLQASFGDITPDADGDADRGLRVAIAHPPDPRAGPVDARGGYVQMARLSGASTGHIMFREMMPNLVPYLFGSFIANVTTSIVTAVGLEVLGLGPQRVPTLGRTIYEAINSGALIQNLWWWWGIPTILLALMFIGLLLINLGLDEVSNPRLRRTLMSVLDITHQISPSTSRPRKGVVHAVSDVSPVGPAGPAHRVHRRKRVGQDHDGAGRDADAGRARLRQRGRDPSQLAWSDQTCSTCRRRRCAASGCARSATSRKAR